ncbi:hypothetical protein Q7L71_24510 [Conexibacter sp. CPCC 205706]|nr:MULTISPECIES: hypothetical protein [unclassified Conexibacter]MDO8188789.1 hypothetical protein [Conexibacter sp. CPCC 205706]MDO8201634.1 hypothetical protein [Conexibacter sp. CPCC 205762]
MDATAPVRDAAASEAPRARTAFLAGAPLPQRLALRALLALEQRPRGAALLERLPAAAQLARATVALIRYDDVRVARPLGWDPAAVVARGRAVREGTARRAGIAG